MKSCYSKSLNNYHFGLLNNCHPLELINCHSEPLNNCHPDYKFSFDELGEESHCGEILRTLNSAMLNLCSQNDSLLFCNNPLTNDEINEFSKSISQEAEKYSIQIKTCSEKVDLACFNIQHGSCIDKQLLLCQL